MKIIEWIKEHVRPYVDIKNGKDEDDLMPENKEESIKEKIEDIEKNTEVGIKVTWKF